MNSNKANRQFAASLARKYFGGQISKHELLDNFPDYSEDTKLATLLNEIAKEPKIGWFFGVSKAKHLEFVIVISALIDDLEK